MDAKYIRKVNGWLVAEPCLSKNNKKAQKLNWFPSEEEALKFINSKQI